jgi:hypothetical protein
MMRASYEQEVNILSNLRTNETTKLEQQNSRQRIIVKFVVAFTLCAAILAATFQLSTPKTEAATNVSTNQASVIGMIEQVFGPYAGQAINVARCESGFNPSAYNNIPILGSHAQGVFQILYPVTWNGTSQAGASPYNARANIIAAHEIFVRDGYSWREWECQP